MCNNRTIGKNPVNMRVSALVLFFISTLFQPFELDMLHVNYNQQEKGEQQ